MLRVAALASCLLVVASGASIAEDSKPGLSFAQLTAAGFEIRAVTMIRAEDRKALVADGTTAAVFVTLQKQGSTAVCQFAAIDWTYQSPQRLEAAEACSVYPPGP